ncbi:alpha/beta hydrolase [Sorangium sp. So ce128]|uniref:alpha/beta hydrolase n=1 Tax=Sorangium sp. So ce128 TaxID=3133281 RepID=UPI003F5E38BF
MEQQTSAKTHVIYLLGPYRIPGFHGERNVRVYLPDEGARDGRPSPVLFLFDGQNVFHDDPSYSGGWHLHEAVHDLANRGLEAPVLVGIDHGGPERLTELSPFPGDGSEGKLDEYLGWLTSEIVPAVQERFAVRRDPASTAIGGSSMGGLAALYAHWRCPDVFGAALCMSPSLWFAERKIFDVLASLAVPASSRLYVDAGAQEDGGSVLRDAARLVEQLRQQGYREDNLLFCLDEDGTHSEDAWRRRAPGALQFLFSGDAREPQSGVGAPEGSQQAA